MPDDLRRLPDHMVLMRSGTAPTVVLVGAHEDHLGALFWTRVESADLPQNLTRVDDFIGAILAAVDRLAIGQLENGVARRQID